MDLRRNGHHLRSSENKAWKKFRPVQDLNQNKPVKAVILQLLK